MSPSNCATIGHIFFLQMYGPVRAAPGMKVVFHLGSVEGFLNIHLPEVSVFSVDQQIGDQPATGLPHRNQVWNDPRVVHLLERLRLVTLVSSPVTVSCQYWSLTQKCYFWETFHKVLFYFSLLGLLYLRF